MSLPVQHRSCHFLEGVRLWLEPSLPGFWLRGELVSSRSFILEQNHTRRTDDQANFTTAPKVLLLDAAALMRLPLCASRCGVTEFGWKREEVGVGETRRERDQRVSLFIRVFQRARPPHAVWAAGATCGERLGSSVIPGLLRRSARRSTRLLFVVDGPGLVCPSGMLLLLPAASLGPVQAETRGGEGQRLRGDGLSDRLTDGRRRVSAIMSNDMKADGGRDGGGGGVMLRTEGRMKDGANGRERRGEVQAMPRGRPLACFPPPPPNKPPSSWSLSPVLVPQTLHPPRLLLRILL